MPTNAEAVSRRPKIVIVGHNQSLPVPGRASVFPLSIPPSSLALMPPSLKKRTEFVRTDIEMIHQQHAELRCKQGPTGIGSNRMYWDGYSLLLCLTCSFALLPVLLHS